MIKHRLAGRWYYVVTSFKDGVDMVVLKRWDNKAQHWIYKVSTADDLIHAIELNDKIERDKKLKEGESQ